MKKFNLFTKVRVVVAVGVLLMNFGVGAAGGFGGFGGLGGRAAAESFDDVGVFGAAEAAGPGIYIKAINPGYTVDKVSNVGEMIEIARKDASSDDLISLAGVTVRYATSGGKNTDLLYFPEHSYLVGESIILRLASSPGSELAAERYTKTLAFEGSLTLLYDGEVVDSVCWTGGEGCVKKFKSASPTVLVRNLETGEFEHIGVGEYAPEYHEGDYVVKEVESGGDDGGFSEDGGGVGDSSSGGSDDGRSGDGGGGNGPDDKSETPEQVLDGKGEVVDISQCRGLVFSEILSYYAESKTEQFIEFYNMGAEQILMDGCQVKYKNKYYGISGIVKPEEYFAWYLSEFNLTKNPTSTNILELIDADGSVVDTLEYPNGQKKGTTWAWIGYDEAGEELWRTTYAATPGEANVYQEYRTCEEGKVINEATGNCVKVTEVVEKTCAEGQYLNPLTGRCKKIEAASSSGTTECKEGYYYYEATGRCRKIVENNGANYSLETENYEEKSSFVALYAVVGVAAVGLIYVIYEFRHEIQKLWLRVWRRSH